MPSLLFSFFGVYPKTICIPFLYARVFFLLTQPLLAPSILNKHLTLYRSLPIIKFRFVVHPHSPLSHTSMLSQLTQMYIFAHNSIRLKGVRRLSEERILCERKEGLMPHHCEIIIFKRGECAKPS